MSALHRSFWLSKPARWQAVCTFTALWLKRGGRRTIVQSVLHLGSQQMLLHQLFSGINLIKIVILIMVATAYGHITTEKLGCESSFASSCVIILWRNLTETEGPPGFAARCCYHPKLPLDQTRKDLVMHSLPSFSPSGLWSRLKNVNRQKGWRQDFTSSLTGLMKRRGRVTGVTGVTGVAVAG